MGSVKNLLLIEGGDTRARRIRDIFPAHWGVTRISELVTNITGRDEVNIDVIDGVIITGEAFQTDEDTVAFFNSVYSEREEMPVVIYGDSEVLTDNVYKYAYENDVDAVFNISKQGVDGLHACVQRVTAVGAVDIQSTTFAVAQSLMSAEDDELEMKIEWALQSLGERLDAIECAIYECDTDVEQLTKQYGWSSPPKRKEKDEGEGGRGGENPADVIGNDVIAANEFPEYDETLSVFSTVYFDEYATSEDGNSGVFTDGVGTVIAVPLVIEWELQAVFVVQTEICQEWSDEIQTQLEAVGELILHTNRRREQRAALEQQNEQLEQFNSVISHDLQNPLSIARGYVELVQETGDVSELETALDAITRMEDMITELLTLARQGDEIGETNMNSIRDIIESARDHVSVADGVVCLEDVPSDVTVECDASRVQELFENLFRNAVDHCGDNVTVTVTVTDDGEIIVGDDGPGIPPEKREEIFEHGYTGGDGTGFGLAIVKRVVDAHGWRIEVGESDAGGAAFIINTEI